MHIYLQMCAINTYMHTHINTHIDTRIHTWMHSIQASNEKKEMNPQAL